jgi:hypothetical protein
MKFAVSDLFSANSLDAWHTACSCFVPGEKNTALMQAAQQV